MEEEISLKEEEFKTRKIRAIVADDHPIFLFGLKTMIMAQGIDVLATAENGADAVELVAKYNPDIAILDIIMPVMDGVEAAGLILRDHPGTRVLMLSSDTNTSTMLQLANINVDGFVSKNTTPKEIVNAINTVSLGYNYFGADIARIIERIHSAKNPVDSTFTPREIDIIRLSCEGLQYKEIADRLNIKTKTVDNIKSHIFHKLGINNTVELVRYSIINGIISL